MNNSLGTLRPIFGGMQDSLNYSYLLLRCQILSRRGHNSLRGLQPEVRLIIAIHVQVDIIT